MLRKSKVLAIASAIALYSAGISLPASAATAPSLRAALGYCMPSTTYVITGVTEGWAPTTLGSYWALGPQTVSFSTSQTASQDSIYTGSVSISTSVLGSQVSASYGQSYSVTTSTSTTWSYSAAVPSGKTGRLLILHRMDKINFNTRVDNPNCTTTTTTGLVAYLPWKDTSNSAYCSIMDISPAKTDWKTTCTD